MDFLASNILSDSPSQSGKKSRGGRKTKSDWRKNIDLNDVEKGLRDKQDEELEGGVIEERQDQDLFVTDVAGDQQTKKSLQTKRLRIDEILEKRSSVPAAVIGSKMSEEQAKKKEYIETKKRLKNIASAAERRKVSTTTLNGMKDKSTGTIKYDIWGAPSNSGGASNKQAMSKKALSHLSELPAVEVAHPGASYRPNNKDHQDLVEKASVEYTSTLTHKKYDSYIGFQGTNQIDGMNECAQVIIDDLRDGQAIVAEKRDISMVDGSKMSPSLSDSEDDDEEGEEKAVVESQNDMDPEQNTLLDLTTSKDPKRKTKAARNRQRRHREKLTEERKAKQQVQKSVQLDMARHLGRGVDEKVTKNEQDTEKARKMAEEKFKQPCKVIGGQKVPKLLHAVKLTEELPTSLRELRPESNGFSEVYNSLLKRNFVEPNPAAADREASRKNKQKVKMIEKWAFKDFK